MAESIAIEPHHARHRVVGVAAPSAAFEPRPPEPLPVSRDEPPAPVSRPPLRTSRTRRLWPLAIGSMAVASALAVGHHWYQRQHMTPRQPTSSAALPATDAPFSLHAAWREVERRQASAKALEHPKETPVVSVLDDPVDTRPAEPSISGPPAGEPSPAALLADRMAAAAATDATAGAPALVAHEKEVSAPAKPADTPIAAPSPPPTSISAGHIPATAPATVATRRHQTAPAAKPERAPGMTGLGGPTTAAGSRAAVDQPRRTAPSSSPAPRTASRNGAPAAALGGPYPRPRKPYRRSPAVAAPAAQAAEFPPRDPTIFKRIERTMP